MKIAEAVNELSKLELRSAEVYLRAGLGTQSPEQRRFFADMAGEELMHARTLLEMLPAAGNSAFDLAVSTGDIEAMGRTVDQAIRAVHKARDTDGIFEAVCRLEQGELNSIYESILHYYTHQLLPRQDVETFSRSTEDHLAMLREAGDRFGLGEKVTRLLDGLAVKRLDYYKNIT